MVGISGMGRARPQLPQLVPWTAQLSLGPLGQGVAAVLANDLYWGGCPPPAVQIPATWLRPMATFRQDVPFARAEVAQQGGDVARSTGAAAGDRVFTATVDSAVDVDAANLASWVTTYYTSPLPRAVAFVLRLNARSETEIWRILGVEIGTHIQVTGATGWPDGSTDLVVENVQHKILTDVRDVVWACAPIIGTTTGTAGPWFYSDSSSTSGTAMVPF